MGVNIRALILDVLMEVTEGEAYSHIALRDTLEKYEYLDKRDRAFISRVTEGTLENLIQIDYIIECFSKVPIYNMKPLIRNLLRMSVYQLKWMDAVRSPEGLRKRPGQCDVSIGGGKSAGVSVGALFHAAVDSDKVAVPVFF